MKAFWLNAKMPHGIFILRTMDVERGLNHEADRHILYARSGVFTLIP